MNVFESKKEVKGGGKRKGMIEENEGKESKVRKFRGGNRVERKWIVDSVKGWEKKGKLRKILDDDD